MNTILIKEEEIEIKAENENRNHYGKMKEEKPTQKDHSQLFHFN